MPTSGRQIMTVHDYNIQHSQPDSFMEGENNNGDSSPPLLNHDLANSLEPTLSSYHLQSRPRNYTIGDSMYLYHPNYPGDYYGEFQIINNQQISPTVDPMTPQTSYQMINPDFNRSNTGLQLNPQAPNLGAVPSYKTHQHHPSNTSTLSSISQKSSASALLKQSSAATVALPEHENDYPRRAKPRIATTFWDDERTVCYQVEAFGVLVSRREDTDYVNGTKLLNVAGMTRGKRDGILKSEKIREVIKVGSMNLKGVWIPFERAAEIARNEGIIDALYPLFVRNLKTFYEQKGYSLKTDDVPDAKSMREGGSENKRVSGCQNFSSLEY